MNTGAHRPTRYPQGHRAVAYPQEGAGKPRCKSKDGPGLRGDFHQLLKAGLALPHLVCLYTLLPLTKHFCKIAAVEGKEGCDGNQLKYHCRAPLGDPLCIVGRKKDCLPGGMGYGQVRFLVKEDGC